MTTTAPAGTDRDPLKRAAANAAAELVRDGMVVGLGTGSTTAFALEPLALLCDLARGRGVAHHEEGIPGLGHALEPEHLHRGRRARRVHRLPALVV